MSEMDILLLVELIKAVRDFMSYEEDDLQEYPWLLEAWRRYDFRSETPIA